MSAIQWSGGKLHGASEAKVQGFLHDTKDTRLIHGHSNPDIDLNRTPNNMSYRGLTYQQRCDRYDELMEKVYIKRKSSGANANVTLQKIVICIPEGMQNGEKYDAAQVQSWLNDVGFILEQEFGELLIDIDCHVDEVHKYLDPRKDKDDPARFVWSRIHLHGAIVPAVWEVVTDKAGNPILDSDGKPMKHLVLNAHKFAKKATIVRLNKLVQEMTQKKYGMNFMTGTGKGAKHVPVEDLKRMSMVAMLEEELETVPNTLDQSDVEQQVPNLVLSGPVSPIPPSGPSQDDVGPDPAEYTRKVRHQAEEEAKHITDQAMEDAARISAEARRQADELQQASLQSAMARIAQMRAKLELEKKEREDENLKQQQALSNARSALERDRAAIDKLKADMEATQAEIEEEHKKASRLLETYRADHLQQRRLNEKALGVERAATERLLDLNQREESLAREERSSSPVNTTYSFLKGVLEHEKKAANPENAIAIRTTMRILFDANHTPNSWIKSTEEEYIRSRKNNRSTGFNFDDVTVPKGRALPSVASQLNI